MISMDYDFLNDDTLILPHVDVQRPNFDGCLDILQVAGHMVDRTIILS